MSAPDRRAMVERPGKDLSVRRQCALVGVARSGVYRPKPIAEADDLAVMRRIDELHLELPFYGSRRMTFELNKEGRGVNRKRVRRLMRVMGIEALVPRPGTSKAAPGHKIYPYLLRGLKIVEPNHVWAADVTYIPMACGFLYLVAIIDWASRAVLAWRLSNTNDASFCAAALGEALLRFGKPRIFNTDQGSTFTAEAFTSKLVTAGVVISMDGRGRFMDNIFIERLWRSIKYEEVHLKAYADGCEARSGISSWMNFYNFRRPHQAMNNHACRTQLALGHHASETSPSPRSTPLMHALSIFRSNPRSATNSATPPIGEFVPRSERGSRDIIASSGRRRVS